MTQSIAEAKRRRASVYKHIKPMIQLLYVELFVKSLCNQSSSKVEQYKSSSFSDISHTMYG